MKCPRCKREARVSYAFPSDYVCDCTGKLETINNIKPTIQTNTNQINLNDFSFGSYVLDHEYKDMKTLGVIRERSTTNDATFALFNNIINNNKTLVIDATKRFGSFQNVTIMNPDTIEEAYSLIESNLDNYDAILFSGINLLNCKNNYVDSVIDYSNLKKVHHSFATKINQFKTNTKIIISVLADVQVYNVTTPSYLNDILQVSSIINIGYLKRQTPTFLIRSKNNKNMRRMEITLEDNNLFNEIRDIYYYLLNEEKIIMDQRSYINKFKDLPSDSKFKVDSCLTRSAVRMRKIIEDNLAFIKDNI